MSNIKVRTKTIIKSSKEKINLDMTFRKDIDLCDAIAHMICFAGFNLGELNVINQAVKKEVPHCNE